MKILSHASQFHRLFLPVTLAGLFFLPAARIPAQKPYLHLNKVIAKLEQGKTITGIWGLSQNMATARSIIEYNGYPTQDESMNKPMIDFVMICLEHYPYVIADLREFIQGMVSRREALVKGNLQPSVATFVRIPAEGADPVHPYIKQVLDIGAHGVVVPHVRTAEEALRIVQSCRYYRPATSSHREPEGNRGFSPAICSYIWGVTLDEYYERADVWPLNPQGDILVIIMIEDPEGVKNIDAIARVPGIGAIFFGPADYTVSSGNYGNTAFDVNTALNRVKKACDAAGVPFVGFADMTNIEVRSKEKNRLLIIGSDIDKSGESDKVIKYLRGR
jgi:4-hydroxy-2-oxoheptanedioate aldolase